MKLVRRTQLPMFAGFDNLFDDFFTRDLSPNTLATRSLPAVNIKETDQDFQLEVAVPGISKDQVKIEVNDKVLTLSSEIENKQEETNEAGNYTRRQFHFQSFQRSFTLPESVDGENIRARYEDGILQVVLPKREEAQVKGPRLIEIA